MKENFKILSEIDITSIDDMDSLRQIVFSYLQNNRKDVFQESERLIIILGDHDFYVKDKPEVGVKLQIINSACEHVDISKCFVQILTTNKDIGVEIEWLSKTDDSFQRIAHQILEGPYEKIFKSGMTTEYKYASQIPTKIDFDKLSEKEKQLLTTSKTFCMYPWIHMNTSPNGEAMPCCLWNYDVKMGSVKEHTIKELWNGDSWKQLRRDMLDEKSSPGCSRCYGEERAGFFSNRQSANKHHGHHITRVRETKEDGTLDRFEMTYWDIRFSNLCNLSCRSCGHIFSSSWYQDQVKILGKSWGEKYKPLFWAGRHETDMLEQLMEHIDYVEQIYFAGGEPLMMDEHYHILEELERRKKFNVRLVYNTNFTKTKLKNRQVFDYWKKFNSVSVGASLDAMGPRAEYIRHGTKWQDIEANRRMMLEICPGVDFYISPTLSILNAYHLPDFHKDWVEKGLLKPEDLNINLLQDPKWLRADIATPEYKKKIVEKYQRHLEWLRPLDNYERATQGFEGAINFINGEDNSEYLNEFWKKTKQLDEIRKEDVFNTIPELNELT